MNTFKRPWLILSLMAMAIVSTPKECKAIYMNGNGIFSSFIGSTEKLIEARSTIFVAEFFDDQHQVIQEAPIESLSFDQIYCVSGTDQGRLYYTDDHPWMNSMTLFKINPVVDKVNSAESPHFSDIKQYIIFSNNGKNSEKYGNLNLVNVNTDQAAGPSNPTFGSADRDHQVWRSIARNYRLSVRVVPLRTCRC